MSTHDIHFHVPFGGAIDFDNKVIRGVSLITGDVEAEGHALQVDDTTLSQVYLCAKQSGKITVKADHKGEDGKTFKEIVGYLTNFSLDKHNKKVRGDLELLHSDPQSDKIMEMADRMPENFGLSIAFRGKSQKNGTKNCARCEKLVATDLVETPAANPQGLFSAKVDSGEKGMPEITLTEIHALLTKINERQDTIEQKLTQQQEAIESINAGYEDDNSPLSIEELEALSQMSDEKLAEMGITRAEVESAVADATAGGDGSGDGGEGGDADATATAGASSTATAMSAGQRALKEIKQLKAEMKFSQLQQERAEEEHAFSVIETKFEALATQLDEKDTLLAAKDAEISALKIANRTGARHVKPSGEAVTLFTAKDAPAGSFAQLVTAKTQELIAGGLKPLDAKSQAVDFCVAKHSDAYQEFRAKGGKLDLKTL